MEIFEVYCDYLEKKSVFFENKNKAVEYIASIQSKIIKENNTSKETLKANLFEEFYSEFLYDIKNDDIWESNIEDCMPIIKIFRPKKYSENETKEIIQICVVTYLRNSDILFEDEDEDDYCIGYNEIILYRIKVIT